MPQLDPESPLASVRNPFAILGLAGVGMAVAGVVSPAIALTMAVAAASLVRRFRRSRGSERQQLRWLAMAAALAPPVVLATRGRHRHRQPDPGWLDHWSVLGASAIGDRGRGRALPAL